MWLGSKRRPCDPFVGMASLGKTRPGSDGRILFFCCVRRLLLELEVHTNEAVSLEAVPLACRESEPVTQIGILQSRRGRPGQRLIVVTQFQPAKVLVDGILYGTKGFGNPRLVIAILLEFQQTVIGLSHCYCAGRLHTSSRSAHFYRIRSVVDRDRHEERPIVSSSPNGLGFFAQRAMRIVV